MSFLFSKTRTMLNIQPLADRTMSISTCERHKLRQTAIVNTQTIHPPDIDFITHQAPPSHHTDNGHPKSLPHKHHPTAIRHPTHKVVVRRATQQPQEDNQRHKPESNRCTHKTHAGIHVIPTTDPRHPRLNPSMAHPELGSVTPQLIQHPNEGHRRH